MAKDLAAARAAEELGFESVWMGEHISFPAEFKSTYPYDPSGRPPVRMDPPIHDPITAFAYLAAVTTKIKFATGVFILPLRNPFALAKQIATLDQLSNGRFMFGVGSGGSRKSSNGSEKSGTIAPCAPTNISSS